MRTLENKAIQYIRGKGGNFGMMTAILLPVLIGVSGMAYDMTRAVQLKNDMQGIADSAVLSAASALATKDATHAQAKDLAAKFYATQISQYQQFYTGSGCDLDTKPESLQASVKTEITESKNGSKGRQFDVTLSIPYEMCVNPLTAVLTGKKIPLVVQASTYSATESKNAFSMHLILDQSGSMNEKVCENRTSDNSCLKQASITRIEALKAAAGELLDVIAEADKASAQPDSKETKYARLAAVAYSGSMGKSVKFEWGVSHVRTFVGAMKGGGGTDSSGATAKAYSDLIATGTESENNKHFAENEQTPTKYMLLMTDGDNNKKAFDDTTLATCSAAKAKGIIIYSIAFDAPIGGRAKPMLQNCATSLGHYYDANNAAALSAAFKDIGLRAMAASARLTN
jgi:Flp pilus assembly protein TadG